MSAGAWAFWFTSSVYSESKMSTSPSEGVGDAARGILKGYEKSNLEDGYQDNDGPPPNLENSEILGVIGLSIKTLASPGPLVGLTHPKVARYRPPAADPCWLWYLTTAFRDGLSLPCDNLSICPIQPGKKLRSQYPRWHPQKNSLLMTEMPWTSLTPRARNGRRQVGPRSYPVF